jgi:hypothetical protein
VFASGRTVATMATAGTSPAHIPEKIANELAAALLGRAAEMLAEVARDGVHRGERSSYAKVLPSQSKFTRASPSSSRTRERRSVRFLLWELHREPTLDAIHGTLPAANSL